jgi:formate dehydrogenase iron-sulfur subunit
MTAAGRDAEGRDAVGRDAAPGYGERAEPRVGFFTDTTVCIGCKACEVACKEWNDIPEMIGELSGESYDNTGTLDANAWRHVAFIEQRIPAITKEAESGLFTGGARPAAGPVDLTRVGTDGFAQTIDTAGATGEPETPAGAVETTTVGGIRIPAASSADPDFRWLMSSDVCKHCTTAACLDVCPTGSLFKTEFATVVVQEDICNGCGYCVPACPYGVLDRRDTDGRVWKCTLCYDRLHDGQEPACAKACPTDSINFGSLDDLHEMARQRLDQVVEAGMPGAQLYGDGPSDGVDGTGSIFLLLDEPEVYGLPPDPIATTKHLAGMWKAAAAAGAAMVAGIAAAAIGGRR